MTAGLASELTYSDLLRIFWGRRRFLFLSMFAGLLFAIALIFILRPQYECWMIVAPPRQGAESLNFLADDLPPVLAPSSRPMTSKEGDYVRFQQSLRGAAVASIFLKLDGVQPSLAEAAPVRGMSASISTPQLLSDYLEHDVRLEPVSDTESIRLVYRHPDPQFGEKLLRNLVKIGDQLIRLDVRKDVDARVDWLKRELKITLNPDHRQALTRLLMAEERRRMLLSIETPYAVSIVEEATSSPHPVYPSKALLLLVFLAAGLFGGAAIVLAQDHIKRSREL